MVTEASPPSARDSKGAEEQGFTSSVQIGGKQLRHAVMMAEQGGGGSLEREDVPAFTDAQREWIERLITLRVGPPQVHPVDVALTANPAGESSNTICLPDFSWEYQRELGKCYWRVYMSSLE